MEAYSKTAALVGAATIIPLATVIGAGAAEAACPAVKHYALGGVGDPGSAHVPGAPKNAERITYSASVFPVGNVIGEQSKQEAQNKLDRRARAFRAQCPDSRIEVTGYSLGALAAGDTRDQWQHSPTMRKNTKFVLVADARSRNGALTWLPGELIGFRQPWARPKSTIPTSHVCRIE